jgi:hypothetical protein
MEIIPFGKGIIHLGQDVQTTPKRWFDVEHIISRFNFNVVQMNWCALTYKKIPHYLRVYQGWKYGLCMGWTKKVTKFLPTVESWRTPQLALCLAVLYVDSMHILVCQLKDIAQYVLERLNVKKWLFQNVNTELAIHALDQVHCWDTYFRLRIGHYGNFTPPKFPATLTLKTMTARRSSLYFRTVGGQENHVQSALFIESGVVRE